MRIQGWTIAHHSCFGDQLQALITQVTVDAARDASKYRKKRAFLVLAAITKLAFHDIPSDPANPKYRQGDTLGGANKGWFRAKFFQQYRLFFRFSEKEKTIIYAWVNDEDTLRAYGEKTDAYATFRRMLDRGIPPGDWAALRSQIRSDTEVGELAEQMRALTR
jgi:toxin YhaV